MNRKNLIICAVLSIAFGGGARGETTEGVFLDQASGNYIIRYVAPADADGPEMEMEGAYYVHTKVQPVLSSTISAGNASRTRFTFSYSVLNSTLSQQALIDLWVPCEEYSELTQVASPPGWLATVNMSKLNAQQRNVRWGFKDLTEAPSQATKGLAPGSQQDGFSFSSTYLPGVGTACLLGNAPLKTYTTQYLDPKSPLGIQIENQLKEIVKSDHVPRFAALPTFQVPSPFDGLPLLEAIRVHVDGWTVQLMEQALKARVLELLTAAAANLNDHDTAMALYNLTQLRTELRRNVPLDVATSGNASPDQHLAAKVLDFDADHTQRNLVTRNEPIDSVPPQAILPWSETMYAPPYDADGRIWVQWSNPEIVDVDPTYKDVVMRFELEQATTSSFADARRIYSGMANAFRASGAPVGAHWFRVRALLERRVQKNPDDPTGETRWTKYFLGPNVTQVLPIPVGAR